MMVEEKEKQCKNICLNILMSFINKYYLNAIHWIHASPEKNLHSIFCFLMLQLDPITRVGRTTGSMPKLQNRS